VLRSDCNSFEKTSEKSVISMDSSQLVFPHVGSIWVGSILKVSGCCDVLKKQWPFTKHVFGHFWCITTGNNI